MKNISQNNDSFERLLVWQRSQALSVRVYRLLEGCRDYGFRHQMTSAATSISNNIAEGVERLSKAEFRQFLSYAKGSAGETRSQTYIAEGLGYFDAGAAMSLRGELKEISCMLYGLMQSLDRNPESGHKRT